MARAGAIRQFGAAALFTVVVLAAGARDAAAGGTFDPSVGVDIDTTAPDTASGFSVSYALPAGDVMAGGVVTFIPREWGIIEGDAIEDGTRVGTLNVDTILGLVNGSCSQPIPIQIEMYDASLDETDTVSFEDLDGDLTRDFAENNINFDIPDGIFKYPDFIPRIFDRFQEPLRRTAGMGVVAGTPVLVQFLVFAPGTFINEYIPNDPELGFPSVTLLQNFGDPQAIPRPGVITDFCSPLTATNVSFGGSASAPLYVNPQDGMYTFTVISVGQPDAVGDGYENTLDTCPYEENIGNPTLPNNGDHDSDGLDAACDPNDDPVQGGTNSDEDGDGYLNRQDNCPLVGNGERDKDGTGNQTEDEDFGDGIGNPCDIHPGEYDGQLLIETREVAVTIGTGTGDGGRPTGCIDETYDCASPETPKVKVGEIDKGDIQCDDDVDPVDALTALRWVAELLVSQAQGCPEIGEAFKAARVGSAGSNTWGDVDCDDDVDSVDALHILRFVADLSATIPGGCKPLGT